MSRISTVASHETLGLLLVRSGAISRPQLYDALRLQRQNQRLLGTCLIELGYLEATQLLDVLAEQLQIPICPTHQLKTIDPRAAARLPAATARAHLVLPFRFDGKTLDVAVANGTIVPRMDELMVETRSAIRAFAALEGDVEKGIERVYGAASSPPVAEAYRSVVAKLPGGKNPLSEILPKANPPPSMPPLKRLGIYDAVEKVYEAKTVAEIGQFLGRALLNYFSRVVVLKSIEPGLHVVGYAGVTPQFADVDDTDLAEPLSAPMMPRVTYGEWAEVDGAETLATSLRIGRAGAVFLATVGGALVLYGDNDDAPERYEDLNDLELICKEGETALSLLDGRDG